MDGQTDGETDGETGRQQRPRLRIASRDNTTRLSQINRATHLCKGSGTADLKHVLPICVANYHAKYMVVLR